MPILDVEIVGDTSANAQTIADAAGAVLGSAPGGTWVRLRFLETSQYAENGGTPGGIRPVFVTVLLGRCEPPGGIASAARALARSLGSLLGRPVENVHILFEPNARGRIAFGGELLE